MLFWDIRCNMTPLTAASKVVAANLTASHRKKWADTSSIKNHAENWIFPPLQILWREVLKLHNRQDIHICRLRIVDYFRYRLTKEMHLASTNPWLNTFLLLTQPKSRNMLFLQVFSTKSFLLISSPYGPKITSFITAENNDLSWYWKHFAR